MSEASKKMTIEESFEYLDEVIGRMEDPDVTLEESFTLYEKGMKVLRDTTNAIDEVEKSIKLIDDEGKTEDFDE